MRERDKQMLADHYLDFYQMAYTILHEEADVEDAVQDALTDTEKHLHTDRNTARPARYTKHN